MKLKVWFRLGAYYNYTTGGMEKSTSESSGIVLHPSTDHNQPWVVITDKGNIAYISVFDITKTRWVKG